MKKYNCILLLAFSAYGIITANETYADSPNSDAIRGRNLFERNCAHCHGDDARGDEGPDLHNLKKTDVRITKIITKGIKGEMPAFGTKLSDSDVKSLIEFLRSLKD